MVTAYCAYCLQKYSHINVLVAHGESGMYKDVLVETSANNRLLESLGRIVSCGLFFLFSS